MMDFTRRNRSHRENPDYLEKQIVTYLGNKRALLPFIGMGLEIVKEELGKDKLVFADLFSGTGIVARYAKQHADHIIVNDLEAYSRVTNECYLSNRSGVDPLELEHLSSLLEERILSTWGTGFLTDLYAPKDEGRITRTDRVFYTRRNAMYLDTARKAIEEVVEEGKRKYFLGPLLAAASVHANTSGVFKGFYKSKEGIGQFGGQGKNALTRILGEIEIGTPVFSNFETSFEVHQQDTNQLIHDLDHVDIAYLDPPYNQHPYGSNYFMLNLICDYIPPREVSRISGIPKQWNRSKYNRRREAESMLFEVIRSCKAEFVMISYNSEGFISQQKFLDALDSCGEVRVLETPYNTFRGSRNLRNRAIHVTEFLYLLRK
ncbi:MAG: DNA adenine methylase [Trueperaceae bacterium]|nr:MAG: DNA adenine methylase [Trueperaceae bacterium]